MKVTELHVPRLLLAVQMECAQWELRRKLLCRAAVQLQMIQMSKVQKKRTAHFSMPRRVGIWIYRPTPGEATRAMICRDVVEDVSSPLLAPSGSTLSDRHVPILLALESTGDFPIFRNSVGA